jgi:hypothetical protein
VPPATDPGVSGPAQPRDWWWTAALVAGVLLAITVARATYESRSHLQRGLQAEAAGDVDRARLHFGEGRLWRLPLLPWSAEAERHLAALPAGPRDALGGAPIGRATGSAASSAGNLAFGREPAPGLALLGGLAMVTSLLAGARWAWTLRRSWAAVTLAGGIVAALALWAA